jgi:septal ring factor EnvC (AmiA/AmiB activator)
VRAVFGGKAAVAAWLDRFGRIVILEDDGGDCTPHAHLESLAVERGAAVVQKRVIGQVGDCASTKGPDPQLEVRRGREPVDPQAWLVR